MSAIIQKYRERVAKATSLVCVGLDSDFEKLPIHFQQHSHPQFAFNKWIIEQTHELVAAYKPNTAFYEARGEAGWHDLHLTFEYLRRHHPDIVTILDAKRADIGSSNQGYVTAAFDELGADAITLHPYLGQEALAPFLARADKACIILAKTSNPGGGELQDLTITHQGKEQPLWLHVAHQVVHQWNTHGNCMLVVGATYPQQLATIRQLSSDIPILVPGIGAQGGELRAVLTAGLGPQHHELIINSSRGIIFNPDPRAAAQELQATINRQRNILTPQ